MVEKYFITQDDIVKYFAISEIAQGRFDPHILKAQDLDLKPLLNPALYYDFLSKFDNDGDLMYSSYQNLLNGTTYTYGGQTIEFPGIKPMLCAYTMARFLPMNPVNITRYGVVNKINPQSQPVEQAQITYMVKSLVADAVKYQEDLTQFLDNNVTVYLLWGKLPDSQQNSTGLKFFNSAGNRNKKPFGWWNGVYYN